jgi:hypothetical protein
LVSPSGKEVVTKLYLPELEEGACHHLSVDDKESNPIEAIRIVSVTPQVLLRVFTQGYTSKPIITCDLGGESTPNLELKILSKCTLP